MSKQRIVWYTLVSAGAVLALAVVATLAFASGLALSPHGQAVAQAADEEAVTELSSNGLAESALQSDDVLAAVEQALIEVYRAALPSVVDIEVAQRVASGLGQQPGDLFRRGEGSGFVWDKDGHIVTNYHVVKDAETVKVNFASGISAQAEVIGTESDADLAVLKVDLSAAQLQPLILGNSDDLEVGQLALAIGNPYGQDFTMTSGIVSAVDRTIASESSAFSIPEVIQTDTSINPGNSGGPLLNRQGEVIGINTMIISESGSNSGVGFAIPINVAKRIVPTLIEGKEYEYAWLGISGIPLTDEVAKAMSLPASTRGALVISVVQGGPADQVGLRGSQQLLTIAGQEYPYGGDVIIAIQGASITSMNDLIAYLVKNTRPGDQVTLTLLRAGGARENMDVTLGSRP